jgi:putative NADH-flavin reductase
MKLTIFGATGATGTSLTEQALAAGHSVTAVIRDPARLAIPHQQRLEVVTADVLDPASICLAVTDADAVLTAVGPQGTGPSTLRQDSTRSIIQAMQKTGARRLLLISGSVVADEGDMRGTENEIHASSLDWTIFRPPSLTGKAARGTYRTAIDRNLPHCFSISRADLAACMLKLLDDPATIHRHVCIAN